MATRQLTAKQMLEKQRQHRAAVITLAHQSAQRTIKAQLRAQGIRLCDVSFRDLRIQAEAYFNANCQRLIAEAENVIATSPYFARLRIPVFEKGHKKPNTPQTQAAKSWGNSPMTETSPMVENRTLPRRQPNSAYRQREYLTESEVERLIEAARKRGRNGSRDSAAILLAYRHGLRAAELCALKWTQVDLRHGRLHVNRAKGGIESVHPLHGPELRARRPLQGKSPYVFTTEAGTPVTTAWFLRMVQRAGRAAKLPFPLHPHMLRDACGYKLANDGHDTRSLAHYLGHRNLQSTARYTALAPDRFAKFWQD
jgi:type 1 fimbriae regulatory protein FimE